MRAGATSAAEQDLHRRGGALSARPLGSSRLRFVQVAHDQLEQAAQAYRTSPLVESVDLDGAIGPAWIPDDPRSEDQWALAALGAPAAWDFTAHGATSATVAVLDSGIATSHPDLAGRVALSANFTSSASGDRYGHGTAVAGIISAGLNNGIGIAGLSTAMLLDGKVLDDTGVGTQSALLDGIVWATDHGARVINLSVGSRGACTSAIQAAVDYAWNHGTVLVGAAGNDGARSVDAPASCTHVLAVGAIDRSDARTDSSNFGPAVALAAPGESILTADIHGGYSLENGTSLAAAQVSGAAALVWSTRWGTSNRAVVDRLLSTARQVPETGSAWRAGGLDLAAAVGAGSAAASPTATPSTTQIPSSTPTASASAVPTATPGDTLQPTPAATSTATPMATVRPTPTEDPFLYPLACSNGFTLSGAVTTTGTVDPSTGTTASGSATANVTLAGSGCSLWTLKAALPASPTLPAGTVTASCNGKPAV
ncbi:MAG TPA: S8 family serine peptidase, partial [Chloroflexota bacterium]|nr:S8 family serine peptidase [Chloroflexota bacterium]